MTKRVSVSFVERHECEKPVPAQQKLASAWCWFRV